ncbi:hypothetical protein B7463_g2495, partial [Scytalidium lignicola]
MSHNPAEHTLLPGESETEESKMARGALYCAFVPSIVKARQRCHHACNHFNNAQEAPRRELVRLWKDIIDDQSPLPPPAATADEDNELFKDFPWVDGPIHIDYGTNLHIGHDVYINFNATFIDTMTIHIGSRTLIGPNCCFFSGTHPLDPAVRNGTSGPEYGKEIWVGEDCWFGGNVIVLPGVRIGRGVVIGAGSVVTKDVPPFTVVAGNPAKFLRNIESPWNA